MQLCELLVLQQQSAMAERMIAKYFIAVYFYIGKVSVFFGWLYIFAH